MRYIRPRALFVEQCDARRKAPLYLGTWVHGHLMENIALILFNQFHCYTQVTRILWIMDFFFALIKYQLLTINECANSPMRNISYRSHAVWLFGLDNCLVNWMHVKHNRIKSRTNRIRIVQYLIPNNLV